MPRAQGRGKIKLLRQTEPADKYEPRHVESCCEILSSAKLPSHGSTHFRQIACESTTKLKLSLSPPNMINLICGDMYIYICIYADVGVDVDPSV